MPPKERRGLVLIDPPFEAAGRIRPAGARACSGAHRKWPTGIYALWYPIKDARATRSASRAGSRRLGIPRILRAELTLARRARRRGCAAAG